MTCNTTKEGDNFSIICTRGSKKKSSLPEWITIGVQETPAWLNHNGKREACIIKEAHFSGEGDYYSCAIEIIVVNPFYHDQVLRQVFPKPVPSYLLTQRKVEEEKNSHD